MSRAPSAGEEGSRSGSPRVFYRKTEEKVDKEIEDEVVSVTQVKGSSGSGRVYRLNRGGRGDPDDEGGRVSRNYSSRGGGGGRDRGGDANDDEDMKISRLARQMAKLESEENFSKSCQRIEELVKYKENRKYLQRSLNPLQVSFGEVIRGISGVTWKRRGLSRFALFLSKMVDSMEGQFVRIYTWLTSYIVLRDESERRSEASSVALTVQEIFLQMLPHLTPKQMNALVANIHGCFDQIESVGEFRIYSSILLNGLLSDKELRLPIFQDFADFIIGWLIDPKQSEETHVFCLKTLVDLESYFRKDPSFTMILLTQFIEDIEESIQTESEESEDPHNQVQKILLYSRAFQTIITLDSIPDRKFVSDSINRFISAIFTFLNLPNAPTDRKSLFYKLKLISTTNDTIAYRADGAAVVAFLKEQLEDGVRGSWKIWNKQFLLEFLNALGNWIEFITSQSTISDDVEALIDSTLVLLKEIGPSLGPDDHESFLGIIHPLTWTRNVVLLQKLYAWLIGKLDLDEDYKIRNRDPQVVLHVLLCLNELACSKSNSILTLWTLTPTIFDLLLRIVEGEKEMKLVRISALKILKAHCLSHSHFVSSLASSSSYLSDSPGSRFLPSLMKLWLQQLDNSNSPWDIWTMSWILDFLKGSSNYAQLLIANEPTFFHELLSTKNRDLMPFLGDLMEFLVGDPNYGQEEVIQNGIKDATMTCLLANGLLNPDVRSKFLMVLQKLPILVVSDAILPEYDGGIEPGELEPLTNGKFSDFLNDLLTFQEDNSSVTGKYKKGVVRGAVDFLIRSKLRTTAGGKAQEFFGRLQALFKRYRGLGHELGSGFPTWKLDFIFELEKRLLNCIHGSANPKIKNNLPEPLKTFFVTNKTPCTEWMKRMRGDIVEVAFGVGYNPMGYFYACLMGEESKSREFIFQMRDLEGLKGLGEIAAYYCLAENYEQSLEILQQDPKYESSDQSSHFYAAIKKKCELSLSFWPSNSTPPDPHNLSSSLESTKTLLDLQLTNSNKLKLSLPNGKDLSKLRIESISKVQAFSRSNNTPSPNNELHELEITRAKRHLDRNNLNFVKSWLSAQFPASLDLTEWNGAQILTQPDYFRLLTNYLYMAGDLGGALKVSAIGFDLVERGNFLSDVEKGLFHEEFASRMVQQDLDTFGELVNGSQIPYGAGERTQFLLDLHQWAIEAHAPSGWYSYGETARKLAQEEKNLDLKKTLSKLAFKSYGNYLNLGSTQEKYDIRRVNAMIRALELGKSLDFEPSELIIGCEWASFMLELCKMGPNTRRWIVERFGAESGFYLGGFELEGRYKGRKNKITSEMNGYSLVEVNEEPFTVGGSRESGGGGLEKIKKDEDEAELIRGEVKEVVRELQKIGTSPEEYWTMIFPRIHQEWVRRFNALKRDWGRDQNKLKIRLYLQPVVKQIELYWNESFQVNTIAEMSFIVKHKTAFDEYLSKLSSFESLEEMSKTYEALAFRVDSFSSGSPSRLALAHLSPTLSSFDFSSARIPLPGVPSGVTISTIEPIVICLSTKTKPKRIKFRGSDGRMYEYLVKGNENLNIDMGVMELMSVAREVFGTPTRTYSVTPLGHRGGLIQIVEEAIPIFHLYKKYLQRNDLVEKTSEMFWRRMEALDCGDRSNLGVVQRVYDELLGETPSELISRELILSSKDPLAWYKITKVFTRDSAIGAAIGYIVGLGDRHLDNILVKPHNGALIHVDFSIIFGKGATLKIPEKVPFRLTQNMVAALQSPGVAGSFAVYLEEFLSKLKSHSDITLFCLRNIAEVSQLEEVPLIDTEVVLGVELECGLSLLPIRVRYLARHLTATRKEVCETAFAYTSSSGSYSGFQADLEEVEASIEGLTVALTTLKGAEVDIEGLRRLRIYCERPGREEECRRAVGKLRERIIGIKVEYEEAVGSLPLLELGLGKGEVIGWISELEMTLQGCSNSESRTRIERIIEGLQKGMELAKLVLHIGILGNRFPFTKHRLFEILEHVLCAEMSLEWAQTCQRPSSAHTTESALRVVEFLRSELNGVNDQMRNLNDVIANSRLGNLMAEISTLQSDCDCTEEMLARYTNPSDLHVYLTYAIPALSESLKSSTPNYDFLLRVCLITTGRKETPDYREVLLDLNIKAKSLLPLILNASSQELIQAGHNAISKICCILEIGGSETKMMEELSGKWGAVVEQVVENVRNYDAFVKNESPSWSTPIDLLTFLLTPITIFTSDLQSACESAIVGQVQRLLTSHSRNLGAPNPSDPMVVNLNDLQSSLGRLRTLRDLLNGLRSCEASRAWLSSEIERFEWAHGNILPNSEALLPARSGIRGLKSGIKGLSPVLSLEGELGGFPPQITPIVSSSLRWIGRVVKTAGGLLGFESIRFSPTPSAEFKELCKRVEALAKDSKCSIQDVSVAEQTLQSLNGEMSVEFPGKYQLDDDSRWAEGLERFLSSKLQSGVQRKFSIAEEMSLLTKGENEAMSKLSRKLNKLRRILSNLDPLLTFIGSHAQSPRLKELVFNEWGPNVMCFWSRMGMEQLVSLTHLYHNKFDILEELLGQIVDYCGSNSLPLDPESLLQAGEWVLDGSKVAGLVAGLRDKILGFNSTTSVETLIGEATRPENLAQMFEGWTPWV